MTSAPFCMHKRQSRCVSVCFQMRACEAVVQARAIAERRSRPRFLPLSPSLALALSMFSLLIPFALAFCRPGTRSRPARSMASVKQENARTGNGSQSLLPPRMLGSALRGAHDRLRSRFLWTDAQPTGGSPGHARRLHCFSPACFAGGRSCLAWKGRRGRVCDILVDQQALQVSGYQGALSCLLASPSNQAHGDAHVPSAQCTADIRNVLEIQGRARGTKPGARREKTGGGTRCHQ